jgi:hypothetical protein
MDLTKSMPASKQLDRSDVALLATFAVVAVLGTWQSCLLVIDGAVYLAAAWLGNAWDLFFDQTAGRAVATFFQFGPAWALRSAFELSSNTFLLVAHALYFAVPLGLWVILRLVEPERIYSRLYLAFVLALIYFTSEMVAGFGLWLIWLACFTHPTRSRRFKAIATLLLAPAIAFTHPGIAALSITFAGIGLGLIALGRPFPRHTAFAAAAMGAWATAVYFAMAAVWPPSNPTIATQHAMAKYDYIDPVWMLATLGFFPMLAVLWLLVIAPGLETTKARWRVPPSATMIVGLVGLWFAFNGTNSLTWIFARQTAPYVLALALALALASSARAWLAAARRPFMLFAATIAVAAASYTIDLALFGRATDARLASLHAEETGTPYFAEVGPAPPPSERSPMRIYFKWGAAPDYVRDIVVPDYGGRRMTFAFYTFFRSDRRAVLYRLLNRRGEWVPFECAPLDRALTKARDDVDRRFLQFLRTHYCVAGSR